MDQIQNSSSIVINISQFTRYMNQMYEIISLHFQKIEKQILLIDLFFIYVLSSSLFFFLRAQFLFYYDLSIYFSLGNTLLSFPLRVLTIIMMSKIKLEQLRIHLACQKVHPNPTRYRNRRITYFFFKSGKKKGEIHQFILLSKSLQLVLFFWVI